MSFGLGFLKKYFSLSSQIVTGKKLFIIVEMSASDALVHKPRKKNFSLSRHIVAGKKNFVTGEPSAGGVARFTNFPKKISVSSRIVAGKKICSDELSAGGVAPHCRGRKNFLLKVNRPRAENLKSQFKNHQSQIEFLFRGGVPRHGAQRPVFMTAADFEAESCPRGRNEI
jgi:hypothetical protein